MHDARENRPEKDFKGYNVGIAGGDGLVIVDVDPRNGGNETLAMLIEQHGELPDTWTVDTPSRGRHYYFRGDSKSHSLRGIDIISSGKYAVMPPSKVPNGEYVWLVGCAPDECELAELPEYFKLTDKETKEKPKFIKNLIVDDSVLQRVEKMLIYMDPDCNRSDWLTLGMAIHSTGHAAAFDIFHRWSSGSMHKKTPAKYDGPNGIRRVWDSFKQDGGITIGTAIEMLNIERLASGEFDDSEEQVPEEESIQEIVTSNLTDDVQNIDYDRQLPTCHASLLNDLRDEITRHAYIKNPEFSFAAAHSVLGAITQRGYLINYNRGKTSTYQLILGPAACGKESYLSAVTSLVRECNAKLYSGEVRSDQAMKQQLAEFPSRIMVLDEFSDRIYNAYKPKGAENDLALMRIYKELWAIKEVLPGSIVKKSKDNESIKEVEWPMISIFGAGTLERFHDCLNNPDFIDGGMFGRLDLFLIKKRNEQEFDGVTFEFSTNLKNRLKAVYNAGIRAAFTSATGIRNVPDRNVLINVSTESLALFKEFRKICLQKLDGRDLRERNIFDRASEKAMRYAAHHCIGRSETTIEAIDMTYGIEVAKYLVNNAYEMINLETPSDSVIRLKIVSNCILKEVSKSKSNKITMRVLLRNQRAFLAIDKKYRKDVLEDLQEMKFISYESKRPASVVVMDREGLAKFVKNK